MGNRFSASRVAAPLREVAILAPVLLIIGMFVWVVPTRMNRQIDSDGKNRVRGLTDVLASALAAALEFEDVEEASRVLELLGSQEDAEAAVVRRADGKPLARWRWDGPITSLPAPGVEQRGTDLVVSMPVRSTGGTAGTLVARFDGSALIAEKRSNWLAAIALVLVGGIGLGALVMRLFRRRRRAERALADEEAKFFTLVEGMPEALVIHESRELTYANSSARRLFEMGEKESGPIGRSGPLDALDAAIAGGKTGDIIQLDRSGESGTVHLEIRTFALELGGGPVTISLARDVTEQRELQERLALSDRLASIGTLATGVAHEINNPLTYILSNLEFVALECERLSAEAGGQPAAPSPELIHEVKRAVADARGGAVRVRNIVGDMRKLARKEFGERAPIDPSSVVGAASHLARSGIGRRALVTVALEEVPRVMASESQLSQVVVNLVQNAADAIPPDAPPERKQIRVATRTTAEGAVEISVADTGSGISPELRDKIFDPFFTTKPVGVGTGLGLAICHGIVRAHGGTISYESEVGVGTTMRVVLPSASADLQVVPVSDPPVGEVRMGRILVVDDDAPVASATARLLRGDKTEVETNSRRALERLLAGEQYDLVLCDVRMPDMNGPELLQAVRDRAPELARVFVFMTGAVDERSEADLARLGVPVLQKPFDRSSLHRFVSDNLDRLRRAA